MSEEQEEQQTEAKSVTVQVKPGKVLLTPLGFHRYAADYLTATRGLPSQQRFSPVPYYLYCRSLELSLKAFLLTKGVSVDKLKKRLGHDLIKTLKKARDNGLEKIVSVTSAEETEIKKANAYYAKKDFEYFEVYRALKGYPDRPDLEVLGSLAKKLVDKLEAVCITAT